MFLALVQTDTLRYAEMAYYLPPGLDALSQTDPFGNATQTSDLIENAYPIDTNSAPDSPHFSKIIDGHSPSIVSFPAL